MRNKSLYLQQMAAKLSNNAAVQPDYVDYFKKLLTGFSKVTA